MPRRRGTSRVRRASASASFLRLQKVLHERVELLLGEPVAEVLGHDVGLVPLRDLGVRDRRSRCVMNFASRRPCRACRGPGRPSRWRPPSERVAAACSRAELNSSSPFGAACPPPPRRRRRRTAGRLAALRAHPASNRRRAPRARTGASWSGRARTARHRRPRSCRAWSGVTRILVVRPGTASDLSRNCGHPEGVDHVLRRGSGTRPGGSRAAPAPWRRPSPPGTRRSR